MIKYNPAAAKKPISPMHLADLKTIESRLTQLVERVDSILRNVDAFPQARGAWLRRLKEALGLTPSAEKIQTFGDTIELIEKMVSTSGSTLAEEKFNTIAEVNAWLKKNKLKGRVAGKEGFGLVSTIPEKRDQTNIVKGKVRVGNVVKFEGAWQFIPAGKDKIDDLSGTEFETMSLSGVYFGQIEPPPVVEPKTVPLSLIRMRQSFLAKNVIPALKMQMIDAKKIDQASAKEFEEELNRVRQQIAMLDKIRNVRQYEEYAEYLKFAKS